MQSCNKKRIQHRKKYKDKKLKNKTLLTKTKNDAFVQKPKKANIFRSPFFRIEIYEVCSNTHNVCQKLFLMFCLLEIQT